MLEELQALEARTEGVDFRNEQISANTDNFSLGGGRGRCFRNAGGALRRGGRCRLARRWDGLGRSSYALLRGRSDWTTFFLPRFPKHEQGESKNEQQDESLRVHIHGTGS